MPSAFAKPTARQANAAFWRKKIAGNRARDRRVNRALRRLGWQVLRIWEHELNARNAPRLLRRLTSVLRPLSLLRPG